MHKIRIPNKETLIHGLAILITLCAIQLILDAAQNSFLLYLPPLGFAFFLLTSYVIQPIIVGVTNIVIIHRLYCCEGWQIGFWLNGLFLLLAFSSINVALLTVAHVPFSALVAVVEILVLAYPFGYLGKFSNRAQAKTKGAHESPITI